MNRHDFWLAYAKEHGIPQDKSKPLCKSVLTFLAKCIATEDRVHISGLGTFKRKKTGAHRIRNVTTGELMVIPEKEKLIFEPSVELCEMILREKELG